MLRIGILQLTQHLDDAVLGFKAGLADRGLAVCRNKGATAVRPAFSC